MVIKSFDFKTKVRVGDCAPSYSMSWELDETDGVYTLTIDGFEPARKRQVVEEMTLN